MRHKRTAGGRKAARAFIHSRSQRRSRLTPWILPVVLLALLGILWFRIDAKIRPAAEKACLYECRSMTSQVVAEGVADALNTISTMDLQLPTASYDANGEITGLRADADAVNIVQTVLFEQVNAALEEQKEAEFSVRLGTLTGMYTLADRGVEIPLRYAPRGAATVELSSSFSSAGLNQTVHTLIAEVTVEAGCSIPLYQADTSMTFTYLLAETVIVGDVPQVTWSGKVCSGS